MLKEIGMVFAGVIGFLIDEIIPEDTSENTITGIQLAVSASVFFAQKLAGHSFLHPNDIVGFGLALVGFLVTTFGSDSFRVSFIGACISGLGFAISVLNPFGTDPVEKADKLIGSIDEMFNAGCFYFAVKSVAKHL